MSVGIASIVAMQTRIRGKRRVQPISSHAGGAENNTPSVAGKRIRIQGKQKLGASLIPSDPNAGSSGMRGRCDSCVQSISAAEAEASSWVCTPCNSELQILSGTVASCPARPTAVATNPHADLVRLDAARADTSDAGCSGTRGWCDKCACTVSAAEAEASCWVCIVCHSELQILDAENSTPSVTVKRLRFRGKQTNASQPPTSLIPAIQLLESGCGQAAEAAVLQYYMENAQKLAASVSPSGPEVGSHPEARSSSTPTVAGTPTFSRSSGGAPNPPHVARFAQDFGPRGGSRLSQAFRSDAPRIVAMQADPTQLGDDEQISVGAASLAEIPADLRRRAKAGDGRIQVVEDSAASSANP